MENYSDSHWNGGHGAAFMDSIASRWSEVDRPTLVLDGDSAVVSTTNRRDTETDSIFAIFEKPNGFDRDDPFNKPSPVVEIPKPKGKAISVTIGAPAKNDTGHGGIFITDEKLLRSPILVLGSATPNSILASWSKVEGSTGYDVVVATEPTFKAHLGGLTVLSVGSTTKMIEDLKPETAYYVRVRPCEDIGDVSNTATMTTPATKETETIYNMLFRCSGKTIFRCQASSSFLKSIPHFAKTIAAKMRERTNLDADGRGTIEIDLPYITASIVSSYLKAHNALHKSTLPAERIFDPRVAALAHYLEDDLFFKDWFPGAKYRLVLSDLHSRSGSMEFFLPTGNFTPVELYRNMMEMVGLYVSLGGPSDEETNTFRTWYYYSENMIAVDGVNLEALTPGLLRINTYRPVFTESIDNDLVPCLPEGLLSQMAQTYLMKDRRGHAYQRILQWATESPILAKVTWQDNRDVVLGHFRMGRKHSEKLASLEYQKMVEHCEPLARKYGNYFEPIDDPELNRINAEVAKLRATCDMTPAKEAALFAKWDARVRVLAKRAIKSAAPTRTVNYRHYM